MEHALWLMCSLAAAQNIFDNEPQDIRQGGRYGVSKGQLKEPPGEPCDESLFVGRRACCWRVKSVRGAGGTMVIYRYICDSRPDHVDCDRASEPELSPWDKYDRPYECRRQQRAHVYIHLTIVLRGVAFLPGDASLLQGPLVDGIVIARNVSKGSVKIIQEPTLVLASSVNKSILNVTIEFVEDEELKRDLSKPHELHDSASVSKMEAQLANNRQAIADGKVVFSDVAYLKAALTTAFQNSGGRFAEVQVEELDIVATEHLTGWYIDGTADAWRCCDVGLLTQCISLVMVTLAFFYG